MNSNTLPKRSKKASTDVDKSKPTSQGKETALNTNHKTSPLDTKQKGRKPMSDQQNVPTAKSLDKMGQMKLVQRWAGHQQRHR